MDKANIGRINELTEISRQRELTPEELAERQERREAYIKAFRSQMRVQLDSTVVEYPDGSRTPLRGPGRNGKK